MSIRTTAPKVRLAVERLEDQSLPATHFTAIQPAAGFLGGVYVG